MENSNCNYCNYCSYCNYCNSCDSCDSCNSCNSCDSCDSCNSCNSCDYCDSCDSCNHCDYCSNLKMTEYNIFCYSSHYNDGNSFQQARYRVFNKLVTEFRYQEIKEIIAKILPKKDLHLLKFWEQVTQEQWKQLLAIPEAEDFKEGFEFISGQKIITDKVIIVGGVEFINPTLEEVKKLLEL